MVRLPFVVAPRVKAETIVLGTEETGSVEILKQGYITTGERAFVSNQERGGEFQAAALALARKISTALKVDIATAWEGFSAVIAGTPHKLTAKISAKFSEEVEELCAKMIEEEENKKLFMAAAMILYRIEPEFDLEELLDIHPGLIDLLANHYLQEAAGGSRVLPTDEEPTIEDQLEEIQKKPTEEAQKSPT